MEEARQHSALGAEQIAIFGVRVAGLLALLIGIVLQLTIGGRSLHVGLLGFVSSQAVIAFWQAVRPQTPDWKRRRVLAGIYGAIWLGAAVILGLPFWRTP